MNLKQIREALEILVKKGDVHELRILKAEHQGVVSGYFNDLDKMAASADKYNKMAEGIYLTLNPCLPSLLARANNRTITHARNTTKESEILKRRWLPIDIDPIRPVGISSTNEEHQMAIDKAYEIHAGLKGMGLSEGLIADSGNGAHILIRIDLPNIPEAKGIIERTQKTIAHRFNNTKGVDVQMFADSNRIFKLYGTWACKGDSIPERPHRISKLLYVPESMKG